MRELRAISQEQLAHHHAAGNAALRGVFAFWPQVDMRRWQCAGLIGVTVLLQLAGAALAPTEGAGQGTIWSYAHSAGFGALMAPPTLLALWAVFGPQPIAVRLPLTLWLAAANYLALLYGVRRANGDDESSFVYLAAWPLVYSLAQLPLWLVRAVGGWRLTPPMPHGVAAACSPQESATANAAGQYGMRGLLVGVMATALLLNVLRTVVPEAPPDVKQLLEDLPNSGLLGVLLGVIDMPLVALACIILVAGHQVLLRFVLSAVLLAVILAGNEVVAWLSESTSIFEIACIQAGAIANGVACLMVVAACGYRFRRRPLAGDRDGFNHCGSAAVPLSRPRFTLGLVSLLAIASAALCAAPQTLEQWRRQDTIVQWRRGGFDIYFADDSTGFNARHIHGAPVSDEALDQIARLNRQKFLELEAAGIGDRQLSLLAPMSGLRTLTLLNCELTDEGFSQLPPIDALETVDLRGTPLTDAALAHLDALPNLLELFLEGTAITDNGLLALVGLPKLVRLDVCMTAVSKSGVERFLAERPEVTVWYGACDQDLGRWLNICGLPNELAQGILPCRRNPTVPVRRLHLRGTKPAPGSRGLTDAALAVLADLHELEDLDLRDTCITDGGLPFLTNLTALRRLDLRGTTVSEPAVADLSRSLPACQIVGPTATHSGGRRK